MARKFYLSRLRRVELSLTQAPIPRSSLNMIYSIASMSPRYGSTRRGVGKLGLRRVVDRVRSIELQLVNDSCASI